MFKGLIIALILFAAGDFAINEGKITRHVLTGLVSFGSASKSATKNSIFGA